MTLWIIACVLSLLVTGFILGYKGRRAWWALLLSAFLGPVGVIAAVLLPGAPTGPSATWKKCPHCGETIRREATVCRYCGRDL